MPIITLETGNATVEQKKKLIVGLTKIASETLGIAEEHFFVLIKENELDNWGVGGKMLSKRYQKPEQNE